MPKWFVYVLRSLSSEFVYVGSTDNLKRRLSQHNEGTVQSTKHYRRYEIITYIAANEAGYCSMLFYGRNRKMSIHFPIQPEEVDPPKNKKVVNPGKERAENKTKQECEPYVGMNAGEKIP